MSLPKQLIWNLLYNQLISTIILNITKSKIYYSISDYWDNIVNDISLRITDAILLSN